METQDVVSIPDELPADQVVPKPRHMKLIVGVIALIGLLAGAAFVGGQLLNRQTASGTAGGPQIMTNGGPAASGSTSTVSMGFESAKELPATPPDVSGLFAERKDNSVFVTVGNEFGVSIDDDGTVHTLTNGNGQKLEVVVTSETSLYKDVTDMSFNGDSPNNPDKIQQKVAPGSLDELGQNSFVTAWGEQRGDRLIAKVLLYSPPMIMAAPVPAAP